MSDFKDYRIAVLLPCHNEAIAIAGVVKSYKDALPEATIYVYDNCSSDNTAEIAEKAGAVVRHEPQKGKGNVVRRMFADIDADIYLMSDGDETYEATAAPKLVSLLIENNLDMVVGTRAPDDHLAVSRAGHRIGNEFLTRTVTTIFGKGFTDMLSGYRAFSRRFVKSFPAMATGFETETEITIHALSMNMPTGEVATRYFERPEGSTSKLNTYRDGFRILGTIVRLLEHEKPLAFFGSIASLLALLSLGLAIPLFDTYLATGLVPRVPTAILVTGMMILSFVSLTCGIILNSASRAHIENKRLCYLSYNPVRRCHK